MNTTKSIRSCLHWLWNASRGFRLRILISSLTGVLHIVCSLLFIWFSKLLVDISTGHQEGDMPLYILLLVGCLLGELLLSVTNSRISVKTEITLRNALRQRLFTHLMESRWNGREQLHTGDLLNRLEEDVDTIANTISRTVPVTFVTFLQFGAAFVFLCTLEVRLAAVLLIVMPIALLLSKVYMNKMRRLTREIRNTDSRVQTHLQENLQHRTLVTTLEYTSKATGALNELQGDLRQQIIRRNNFSLFSRSMIQIGFSTGYLIAFIWGVFGLRNGTITFGLMTAFLQLVSQVQRPIVGLSQQLPKFIHVLTSVERVTELTDMPLEEQGSPIQLSGRLGIRLDGLTFTYPGSERPVLQAFSHDFTPGSLTAILGETGVGKSTLIRLLLALLLPDKGSITFYNHRKEITASPRTRCNLVYVPQGNTLLSGTIRQNLLIGKPDATEEELQTALHTAVADFVYELPNGLDTLCGELGSGLSEGQAQRIAIARGLLRPGGILLLDEPTSSLDAETERELLIRLQAQVADKTLLLVTHKEATAQLCTHTVCLTK